MNIGDGSILPTSTGRNPSHPIAAPAEHIAAHSKPRQSEPDRADRCGEYEHCNESRHYF